ncbi:DNA topoisomerase 1-like isoform X4 [Mangifera indica]|uniref:DNA topoisomerase 1-like isoform X4 n=1 Tax=Mangifera indica TaxID=29780 RepID=UPI001CFA4584|nr:DNA topoisomerase 1-like isoform X4 [Mangifera indica]
MRLAMSSLVSSTTSTRSAFLLRRFMATLQYRTLHSSFGFGNKYNKCCLLKCLNTWQSFHLFRSLPGACRFNSRYISSFLPLDRGIKLASLNSILFPRRYFFYVSKAANEEKRGNSFPFKFKKSWIQTKALASARKNQDVNMVTSASEQLVQDAKEGVTQKSKVNNKTKQPSRSKKSKEKLSAATASEQATVEKSPTLASKKTSTGITTVETLDSSVSTKQQSNKKSENSSRKGKCSKVASQKQKLEKVIIKKHQGQKKLKPLYPPIGKSVVVVESVTKAKVFQGYLGDMYEVLPSYGHIRDLAARSGSVRPDDDFSMVWEVSLAAWTHLQSIRMALNGFLMKLFGISARCSLKAMLTGILDEDSLKLYTLIWSRTMACQMEPAIIGQIQLDIGDTTESIVFRSSCSKVEFLGFQAVYEDANAGAIKYKENEEKDRDEAFEILNSLKSGEPLSLGQVELKQHHSQPPPRYSEGSLVKKLEELGIGRPSTYASTLKVLQDRKYVTVKSHVLYPEFRGRMVSAFLSHHFSEVTNYSFTADTETELDNVSAGVTEWKGLLKDYWTRFNSYCTRAQRVHIHQVEEMLGKTFGDFLFASIPNKDRACPSCGEGTLIFRVSRFGAGYFIGCNQHPKCKYIAKTLYGDEDEEEDAPEKSSSVEEPRLIGLHPGSHEKVLLKSGPYGFYVQLGEDRMDYAPKRVNASHIKDMDSITLEDALELLRFPLTLGNHPKDGHPVILRHGNTGFTVRHRGALVHVPKNMNPRDVTLEKALKFLSGKDVKLMGRRKLKVEEPVEAM